MKDPGGNRFRNRSGTCVRRMKNGLMAEMERHYFILWAILFGAGIYAGSLAPGPGYVAGYLPCILLVTAFMLLGCSSLLYFKRYHSACREYRGGKMICLVLIPSVIFLICGYTVTFTGTEIKVPLVEDHMAGNSARIRLQGRVLGHPETAFGKTRFDLILKEADMEALAPGGVVSVVLEGPDTGQVDIKRDDMLDITGYIQLSGNEPVLRTYGRNVVTIADNSLCGRIFGLRQRFYNCIGSCFSYNLGGSQAALASALILGDRRYISDHQYDIFRQSGTAHLMAISGLHISFMAAIIYIVLEKIFRRYVLILLLAAVILLYDFILGPGASMIRATIWVLGAAACMTWERQFRPAYVLCLSFIFILIINPGFTGDAGFWLSFSAMGGIVFIYPVLRRVLSAIGLKPAWKDNYLASTILMTSSIQLTCGPLLLYYFGSLPLIAPVSNLLIIPFFYLLIFLLFYASAISIVWPPFAGIVLKPAPYLIRIVCSMAEFFSDPRFPRLDVTDMQVKSLFIYYTMLFLLFYITGIIMSKKFDF